MNLSNRFFRLFLLALIALTGCTLSFYIYEQHDNNERSIAHARFIEEASIQALRAQQLLDSATQTLDAFGAFFAASDEVSRADFIEFGQRLIQNRPEIVAINWAPKITHTQRSHLEKKLQTLGYAPHGLFDAPQNPQTRPRNSPARNNYFPIVFSVPQSNALAIIGLDVLSRQTNQETALLAGQDGHARTTTAFTVFHDDKSPLAAAIFQPVYERNQPVNSVTDREKALKGYLVLVFKPEVMFANRLNPLLGAKFPVRLLDKETSQQIFPHGNTTLKKTSTNYQFELNIPGRQWLLEIKDDPPTETDSLDEWLLTAMLAMTVMSVLLAHRAIQRIQTLRRAHRILQQKHQNLEHQARTDPLTGLPNRASLIDRADILLRNEARHGTYSAICMVDLDNFKPVNDELGHHMGDQLLQEVARIFRQRIRQGDVAARLGGDEFVLLLPQLSDEGELHPILERIIEEIGHRANKITQTQTSVTISIGVALSSPACRNFNELLKRADEAMYLAKSKGKNCYEFWKTPQPESDDLLPPASTT